MRGRGFLIALTATGKENGMKTLLISACLLGVRCRYDGGSKPQPGVEELAG